MDSCNVRIPDSYTMETLVPNVTTDEVELAIAAMADVLVSSDVHLLEMHPFRGVQILQLTDFKQQVLGGA